MLAKIHNNFGDLLRGSATGNDYDNEEFKKLEERIAGKIVTLTFTGGDAFEAIDNDFWLPDFCWTEIK